MSRNVLVTEGDSPLGAAIVRLLLSKGYGVVTTHAAAPGGPSGGADAMDMPLFNAPPCATIPWNRKSPASARNVVVSALNSLGSIDEAFIVECPPPRTDGLPSGTAAGRRTASADVEKTLDDAKGAVFLSRESLSHFQGARAGLLCMVSYSARAADDPAPALERAAHECFRGYASGLLSAPIEEGIRVNGFQASGASPDELAAFIEKSLDEKGRKVSGRWFTCQAKGGFLQGMWPQGQKKT